MDGLIALSEIARNLALPGIAVVGAFIAFWQTRIGRRKNGFDLLAKAAELRASTAPDTKLLAYALLAEAIQNTASRNMAKAVLHDYIEHETDPETLKRILRLVEASPEIERVARRLDERQRQEAQRDG